MLKGFRSTYRQYAWYIYQVFCCDCALYSLLSHKNIFIPVADVKHVHNFDVVSISVKPPPPTPGLQDCASADVVASDDALDKCQLVSRYGASSAVYEYMSEPELFTIQHWIDIMPDY